MLIHRRAGNTIIDFEEKEKMVVFTCLYVAQGIWHIYYDFVHRRKNAFEFVLKLLAFVQNTLGGSVLLDYVYKLYELVIDIVAVKLYEIHCQMTMNVIHSFDSF